MKIANFKIGTRLLAAFGFVTILSIVLSVLAFNSLSRVGGIWVHYSDVMLKKSDLISASQVELGDTIHNFKDYVLRARDYDKKFAINLQNINTDLAAYKEKKPDEQEQALLTEISSGVDTYRLAMDKAIAMKKQGATIEQIDAAIAGADKKMGKALAKLKERSSKDVAVTEQSITETVELAEKLIVVFGMAVVLLAALCAWLVTRSITRPLGEAVKIAKTVAAGDLSCHIDVTTRDESGQLLQALKEMNGNLQAIVEQVRAGTETIATASGQIATGNLDLSSRTEQQAGSLQETASSMEELNATVRQNGDNVRQANQLALSASDIAARGGAVVTQVVETMGSINDSSRKIVEIIAVIDGIAFQTNILALNAAVEAARAGEQGRGFAVVAAEVRNLAQRSAGAAKEIKLLIGDSVDKVEVGSKLVHQAGTTMEEVVASVKRVADIMSEIAAAGREQEAGIDQINHAVGEMDTVTQQNAALVEQAAAAAESLREQSVNLTQVVSIFKLSKEEHHTHLASAIQAASPTSANIEPFVRKLQSEKTDFVRLSLSRKS